METSCCWRPCWTVKGQGYLILWLTVASISSQAETQLNPDPSHSLSPSHMISWTSLAPLPVQTSFVPEHTSLWSSKTIDTSNLPLSETFDSIISPSSDLDSFLSELKSSLSHTSVFEGDVLQTSFVSPNVTVYRTPAVTTDLLSELETASRVESHSEHITPTNSQDSSIPVTVESTVFLDSVASSLRRLSTEPITDSVSLSDVHSSWIPELGTKTENSSSAFVFITPSSVVEAITVVSDGVEEIPTTPPVTLDSEVGEITTIPPVTLKSEGVEAITSTPSITSLSTEMTIMNSTQPSPVFQPSSGETTLISSVEVSSPGSPGVNGSCSEKDTGCVEYRGDDDDEDDALRVKIIVGVTCGAIVLVVIIGVFIGCVLRRRGKMSSGSKIDLSSYWDDSVTLSYINGHIDIPKDSTDEMISLDNDSFLNSLDSMSFTNTWTSDTSKHTNF